MGRLRAGNVGTVRAGAVGTGKNHGAVHRRPDQRALGVGDVHPVVEPLAFRRAAEAGAVNAGIQFVAAKAAGDDAGRRPQAITAARLTTTGLGAAIIQHNGSRRRRLKGVGKRSQRIVLQVEPDGQPPFHRPVPVGDQAQLAHVAVGNHEAKHEFSLAVGRYWR